MLLHSILNFYMSTLPFCFVYVMHQQDRLLSCQLCPAFPPAWKECGAVWLQADIVC